MTDVKEEPPTLRVESGLPGLMDCTGAKAAEEGKYTDQVRTTFVANQLDRIELRLPIEKEELDRLTELQVNCSVVEIQVKHVACGCPNVVECRSAAAT